MNLSTGALALDAAVATIVVRVAWSAGNTIVARLAQWWDRWLALYACQRCDTKVRGHAAVKAHYETHSAEIEAERVVAAESTRHLLGGLFGRPADSDD